MAKLAKKSATAKVLTFFYILKPYSRQKHMKSTHFGVHFKSGHPFESFLARRPDTRIRYVDAKRVNVTQLSLLRKTTMMEIITTTMTTRTTFYSMRHAGFSFSCASLSCHSCPSCLLENQTVGFYVENLTKCHFEFSRLYLQYRAQKTDVRTIFGLSEHVHICLRRHGGSIRRSSTLH